jgi:hypothetical protein
VSFSFKHQKPRTPFVTKKKKKKLLSNPPWSPETKSSFQNLHPNVCRELAAGSELADSKPVGSELAAGELGSMGFMVLGRRGEGLLGYHGGAVGDGG